MVTCKGDLTLHSRNGRLRVIEVEFEDVEGRLERLYEAPEKSELTLEALPLRILSLRHRQDQLTAARDEAADVLDFVQAGVPSHDCNI